MAAPSHNAYTNSASYRRNFDRDLYADSLIVNRGLIHTLKVDHLVTTGPVCFPDGSAAAPSITFCDNLNTGFFSSSANVIDATTNGVSAVRINGDGDVIIQKAAGQLLVQDGTAALPSIAFNSDPDTGMFRTAGGLPAISDEALQIIEFQAIGNATNVAIGNAATVTDVTLDLGSGAASNDVSIHLSSLNGSVHLSGQQTNAPSGAVGAGWTSCTVAAGSSDMAGQFTIVDLVALDTATITFNNTYTLAPHVIVTPVGATAVTAQQSVGYLVASTATTFTVTYTGAGASTVWAYHVIGRDA